jgi:hypothetical protein
MTSRLLWAFDIQQKKNADGTPVPIDVNAYHEGISHTPKEFPVEFKLRSQKHLDTIRKELEVAKVFLKQFDD